MKFKKGQSPGKPSFRSQGLRALAFTLIAMGGIALGVIIWKAVQGTPAETPVILASALMFLSIVLWGRKKPASTKRLQPTTNSACRSKRKPCQG